MRKKIKGICLLGFAFIICLGFAGCGEGNVVFSKTFENGNENCFLKMVNTTTITDNNDESITIGKCADTEGAYTKLGEYRDTFPQDGFVVSIEFYFDLTGMEQGELFTYTVAINDTDKNRISETPIMVQKSNEKLNLSSPNFPTDDSTTYVTKTTQIDNGGWYRVNVSFFPNEDKLNSTLEVVNCETKATVHKSTWEPRKDDSSEIDLENVGGNRYAWINQVNIENGLKIRKVELKNL